MPIATVLSSRADASDGRYYARATYYVDSVRIPRARVLCFFHRLAIGASRVRARLLCPSPHRFLSLYEAAGMPLGNTFFLANRSHCALQKSRLCKTTLARFRLVRPSS